MNKLELEASTVTNKTQAFSHMNN